jgi:hypothetical protein
VPKPLENAPSFFRAEALERVRGKAGNAAIPPLREEPAFFEVKPIGSAEQLMGVLELMGTGKT